MTNEDNLNGDQMLMAWELAHRCLEACKVKALPRPVTDAELKIVMQAIRIFDAKFDNEVDHE